MDWSSCFSGVVSEHMKHYVYALLRPNQVPFYIGMGQGDRVIEHFRAARRGSDSHRSRIIRLGGATYIKLAEELTREQALELEQDLIRLLGREPGGPLVNRTDGGEGPQNMSIEGRAAVAEANRNREWKEETLAIIAEQTAQRNREREWTEASREKVSKRSKGNKYAKGHQVSVEQRAAISVRNKQRVRTSEQNAKQAASLKATWARRKAAANPFELDPYLFWYSSHVESSPALSDAVGLH